MTPVTTTNPLPVNELPSESPSAITTKSLPQNQLSAETCREPITPTDALPERLINLPDELVNRPQWVTWRSERGTKIPYSPTRRGRAKVNDPSTWGTFDQALQQFLDKQGDDDQFTGMGYVFSDDDPFVGFDLDDCVSGDVIHPDAMALINSLDGYAEISPSQTGVKVWVKGALALTTTGTKSRAMWGGMLEVYHKGRWFATTGMEVDR
ncbi:hypothetical protein ACERK3_02275 [Phycisphaerales bacterium AB-hyl4]|uniref:Uncharacterized protein n=1 Tax=Natronomicrosphaera hydrolytica TaxID=3242702 RepID=A0ABV4U166_9BACT